MLLAKEIQAQATSSTTQSGRLILKLPVGGDWTATAPRVDLNG